MTGELLSLLFQIGETGAEMPFSTCKHYRECLILLVCFACSFTNKCVHHTFFYQQIYIIYVYVICLLALWNVHNSLPVATIFREKQVHCSHLFCSIQVFTALNIFIGPFCRFSGVPSLLKGV